MERKNLKNFFQWLKNFLFPKKYFAAIRHLWKISEIKKIELKPTPGSIKNNFLLKKNKKNILVWDPGVLLEITLKKPLRAITPGQFLVIYSEDKRAIWNWMII